MMPSKLSALIWSVILLVAPLRAGENGPDYTVTFLFQFPDRPVHGLPLSEPQALCSDPEGNIFIADTGNHRILRFDQQGRFQLAIGSIGWEREQFDRPLDLSARTGLDLFIADYNNERIERYDLKLNYIASYPSEERLPDELRFGFPRGVDVSRHGEWFVCESEHNRVLKFSATGVPVLSFGDFNWGEGQLRDPVKVEVSRDDLVYVTDQGSRQVVVFDYYGNFVTRFGEDVLEKPNGLTWSDDGKLFVVDSGRDRVVVFNAQHVRVYAWGGSGNRYGAFRAPSDVAVVKDRIYVLDAGNSRVQVFQLRPVKAEKD